MPVVLVLIVVIVSFTFGACPVWERREADGNCNCGSKSRGVVQCDNVTHEVYVLLFHCLTYDVQFNRTTVGSCLFLVQQWPRHCSLYAPIKARDKTSLNTDLCDPLNRTGQLCGQCLEGYGSPVYSYSLACVSCKNESSLFHRVSRYVLVALVPVTVMYVLCISLKVSMTDGRWNGFVLLCQVVSIPQVNMMLKSNVWMTFFSIWNLDLFRSLYVPFCLHPSLSDLHVIALDYLVALYPMLLVFLTYLTVYINDRFKLNLISKVFAALTTSNNGSVLNGVATFLVLSYSKILITSLNLLAPVYVYTEDDERYLYVFFKGDTPYLGREHLPFFVLAIVMITMCNILPMLLLLLYPSFLQSRVNYRSLTTFMDIFQGSYRTHPKDMRFFSAVPFIFRIGVLTQVLFIQNPFISAFYGFSFILLASLLIVCKPYKWSCLNYWEIFLCLDVTLLCFSFFTSHNVVYLIKPLLGWSRNITIVFSNVLVAPIVFYGLGLLIYVMLPWKLISRCFQCRPFSWCQQW